MNEHLVQPEPPDGGVRDTLLRIVHHHVRARRVIDLRAHETDRDKTQWPWRGYDDQGRPVCPYGYAFTANGFEPDQLRQWGVFSSIWVRAKPGMLTASISLPI